MRQEGRCRGDPPIRPCDRGVHSHEALPGSAKVVLVQRLQQGGNPMPLTVIPLPYGVRDVKICPLTADTPGTGIDFPNARTLSFSEAEDFEELRGDDGVVAVHGSGPSVDWELEGGGFSFEAVKALYGGAIIESGTTPNQKKIL